MRLVEHFKNTGVITSPRYPNLLYFFDGKYTHRITVEMGYSVQIVFDTCILKRNSEIIIYDGYEESNSAVLSHQQTDGVSFEPIISTSNVVFISFSILTFSESKFKLIWNQVSNTNKTENNTFVDNFNCTENSIINLQPSEPFREITSPGFPFGYGVSLNCKWTFLPAVPGYQILLNLPVLDLESTEGCVADYIMISSSRDLVTYNDSGRMCTMDHESTVLLYHGAPYLKLQFTADSYMNKTGFRAEVELSCGGFLDAPNGLIDNEMAIRSLDREVTSCLWIITVKRGRTIQFKFNNYWAMRRNTDGSCANHIIIRNGDDIDAPFLGNGKFCDTPNIELPPTAGNKAYVQYVREVTVLTTDDAFKIEYRQVEHDCGGEIILAANFNSTTISSPNYPNIPAPFIECIWKISAPNGELIKIDFIERFDLAVSRNCTQEYIEIRDGSTMAASLVGRFCDEKPSTQITTSNMARIHYFTDIPVPKNGFKATVSIAKCGGSFTSWKGFISSNNYPGLGE